MATKDEFGWSIAIAWCAQFPFQSFTSVGYLCYTVLKMVP